MTRREVLEKALDRAEQRLCACSSNTQMTEPEKGCEKEWAEAHEEIHTIDQWLSEMEGQQ